MHPRTLLTTIAATVLLGLLGATVLSRAEPPARPLVLAQTSFEERKEDFIIQTRAQVQKLRYQVQTFRRQLGEDTNPQFEAARLDFETKAKALSAKLDEVEALPFQQARPHKPEVDTALQGVLDAYDRIVSVTR